jgi:hypothetical protein
VNAVKILQVGENKKPASGKALRLVDFYRLFSSVGGILGKGSGCEKHYGYCGEQHSSTMQHCLTLFLGNRKGTALGN